MLYYFQINNFLFQFLPNKADNKLKCDVKDVKILKELQFKTFCIHFIFMLKSIFITAAIHKNIHVIGKKVLFLPFKYNKGQRICSIKC